MNISCISYSKLLIDFAIKTIIYSFGVFSCESKQILHNCFRNPDLGFGRMAGNGSLKFKLHRRLIEPQSI